jgi:hypothetical protein
MFAKRMPTFKLFLVVSTLIGFSSFLLTPPTFAGNPGGTRTGSQRSGSPSSSSPQCTKSQAQVDCRP